MTSDNWDINILSTAEHDHTLLYQSVPEARVICWRSDALPRFSDEDLVPVSVLGKRDVDKGNIQVHMGVLLMLLLQTLCSLAEPVDLALLDPVVALEAALVGRIRMRV